MLRAARERDGAGGQHRGPDTRETEVKGNEATQGERLTGGKRGLVSWSIGRSVGRPAGRLVPITGLSAHSSPFLLSRSLLPSFGISEGRPRGYSTDEGWSSRTAGTRSTNFSSNGSAKVPRSGAISGRENWNPSEIHHPRSLSSEYVFFVVSTRNWDLEPIGDIAR